jgi:Ca-activated chloride channel homolog
MRKVVIHLVGAVSLFIAGYFALGSVGPDIIEALKGRDIVVREPSFVWVLCIIPLLLLLRATSLSDLPRTQQIASFVFRAAMVIAATLSLIGLEKIEREDIRTTTVFVVDTSDSVPDDFLEQTRQRIEAVWNQRGLHTVRVVSFAGNAKEEDLPAGGNVLPPLTRRGDETGKATNVQGALQFAFALLDSSTLGRIVLVTDGKETEGDLLGEERVAQRFHVPIHYLDFSELKQPAELMVTNVEVPSRIRAGIPFETKASVEVTAGMDASCELFIDGVLEKTLKQRFEEGRTPISWKTKMKDGGEKKVKVTCLPKEASNDRFASNNTFTVTAKVPEKPRVLYVEGERKFRKNLLAALDKDFRVELRGPRGVPSTLGDAKQFELIFLSDVPRTGGMGEPYMSTHQMKVLDRYARAGGGVVLAGGENSFGPGGYTGTYLERKVLPVKLEVQKKEDMPGLALMLVIDRSGSMSGAKISLAKEAARATLDVLQPSDKLGVITFDSSPTTVVRLQRAANRLKITDSIRRINSGGGTDIFPALDRAYQMLATTQAKVKHIILLTDGQSNRSGILELVGQSYQDRITISSVAVGRGSDQSLLMQIAEEGGGRYYFTDRADNIPKLFLKETSEVSRRALVEDRFKPQVSRRFRRLQIFKGLNMRSAPPLLGYVSTRAKARAEVLMTSHLGEPILARWSLGMGKVVVWTSDVKNRWSHYWLKWPGYAQFWRQLIRDTRRVEKDDPTFDLVADISHGVLSVGVDAVGEDDKFMHTLTSQLTVTTPDGTEKEVTLSQKAAGRWEGSLPLDEYGPYVIEGAHAKNDDDDKVYRSFQTLSWPFPQEYLAGKPDLSRVMNLADSTGGVAEPSEALLFDNEGKTTPKHTPLWPYPLYVVVGLLLLDLLIRRVRFWGDTEIKFRAA